MAPDTVNPGFELDDWALIELRSIAQERLGLPVVVENIANAAAVGEHLLGAGARFNSFAYINVAAGFGGGLVIERRLMRGWMGNAGEIAGLFDLFDRPRPNLVSLQDTLARHGVICESIADLVARFDMDWPGVDEWLDGHASAFSLLFNALRMVLDTEAIILGGRLPRALAHRILAAHRWREDEVAPRRNRAAPYSQLCVAELAPELSAPLGAAALILERELFH